MISIHLHDSFSTPVKAHAKTKKEIDSVVRAVIQKHVILKRYVQQLPIEDVDAQCFSSSAGGGGRVSAPFADALAVVHQYFTTLRAISK